MADSYFTLSSSVVVKTDNKVKLIVSNRLYRFNNKKTWNDVFDELTDPEEVDLKKTDQILVTVSDRAGQTFEPNMEESGAPKKEKEKKEKNLPTYLPIPKSHGSGLGTLKYF
jgi:hypothetical protein